MSQDYNFSSDEVKSATFWDRSAVTKLNGDYSTTITGYIESTRRQGVIGVRKSGSKSGLVTPNYHTLVTTGRFLPVNSYSRTESIKNYKNGSYRDSAYDSKGRLTFMSTRVGYLGYDPLLDVSSVDMPTSGELASLEATAVTRVRLRMKDMRVNVAQVIAERNKTAETVAKAAVTIAQMLIALKQGNLKKAGDAVGAHVGRRKSSGYRNNHRKKPLDAVARGWLELKYAWEPLLMDVRGAAEALAKQRYRPIRGKASGSASITLNQVSTSKTSSTIKTTTNVGSYGIRFSCIYEVSAPQMPDLSGMGLLNPALLAWELMPYSFVIDWFLPIGDWLNSLDATVGLTFTEGSKTTKYHITKKVREISHYTSGTAPAITTYDTDYSSDLTVRSFSRQRLTSFPSSQFPAFKNPASLIHMANGLALLVSAVRR